MRKDDRFNTLPDDPQMLKQMVAQLLERVDEIEAGRQRLERRAQELELSRLRLEMELLKYKKWYYGPRADRLSSNDQVNQMLLEFARDLAVR